MSSRCKHVHVIIPFEIEFRLRTTLQALQGRRGEQLHAAVESEIRHVRIQSFHLLSLSLFQISRRFTQSCSCVMFAVVHACLLCHVACAVVALFCVCIPVVRIPLAFRFK